MIEPPPADAVAVIVGAVSVRRYGPLSPLRLKVLANAEIVKLAELDVADVYPPASVIDAVIVQVPASTNATSPDDELIVHTEVVELEYDLVPLPSPAEAVDVMVGFVPTLNAYGLPAYDDASIDNVREVGVVTVTVIVADDAAEYVESPASSARILHDPVFDESAVNVDPETEQ